tara:strand:- start:1355 stop:1741 length:387 start_codon:yes stop_codon:yes gene_type:complete
MTDKKIIEIIKSHINHCGKDAKPLYSLGYETAVSNIIRDINGAYQRELDGKMSELGERNYALIVQGIKSSGTYDPNEMFFMFEESLYVHEADTIWDFLDWVNADEMARRFGHGNYEQRFQEYLTSKLI